MGMLVIHGKPLLLSEWVRVTLPVLEHQSRLAFHDIISEDTLHDTTPYVQSTTYLCTSVLIIHLSVKMSP